MDGLNGSLVGPFLNVIGFDSSIAKMPLLTMSAIEA